MRDESSVLQWLAIGEMIIILKSDIVVPNMAGR